jgi:hypothetical protein
MKYLLIFSLSCFFVFRTYAQHYKADFGIALGGDYYLGELNPSKQFHETKPDIGTFIRFNINKRFAFRISGYYMTLTGNDSNSSDLVIPYGHAKSFYTSLLDITGQLEINFLPYLTGQESKIGSPYIAGGIGYSLGLSNGISLLTVPFGLGYKYNITNRLSTGLEWSFRKTFNDKIDNITSPNGSTTLHNNDWYSTFGVLITYKFVKFAADCAAYK